MNTNGIHNALRLPPMRLAKYFFIFTAGFLIMGQPAYAESTVSTYNPGATTGYPYTNYSPAMQQVVQGNAPASGDMANQLFSLYQQMQAQLQQAQQELVAMDYQNQMYPSPQVNQAIAALGHEVDSLESQLAQLTPVVQMLRANSQSFATTGNNPSSQQQYGNGPANDIWAQPGPYSNYTGVNQWNNGGGYLPGQQYPVTGNIQTGGNQQGGGNPVPITGGLIQ